MQTLGMYLKAARKASKLSLEKVAQATGITDSRLSRIEKGQNTDPSPDTLKKLSDLYGVSVIEVFIHAGYIEAHSLDAYKQVFHNVDRLDDEERAHIQQEIDFLISRYKDGGDGR